MKNAFHRLIMHLCMKFIKNSIFIVNIPFVDDPFFSLFLYKLFAQHRIGEIRAIDLIKITPIYQNYRKFIRSIDQNIL